MQPAPPANTGRILTGGISVLAALPYLGQLGGGFLDWDDDRFITGNPLFAGPIGAYVRAALTSVQFEAYHPLHLLSYLPDRLLWPTSATGFRALNLVLLAAAATALYRLLLRRISPWPACLAALLITWHPVVTESAAWITARKDLLCLLLVIGVLHLEDRAPPERRLSFGSLALTLAAILTKTAALVVPVFVFAWHRYVRGDSVRGALLRTAPSAAVAVVTAVLVTMLWQQMQMLLPARPLPAVVDVAGTLGFYLRHLVYPAGLSPLYPTVPGGFTAGAGLVVLLAGAGVLFWPRLPGPARFASITFFGALLPVANLAPLYYRFADRYQLLALLGLAWPVAVALERAWSAGARGSLRRPIPIAVTAACLLAEGATAFVLSRSWRDSSALWARATSAQPGAFFAWLKLGAVRAREQDWPAASGAYRRAIEVDPDSALGYAGLLAAAARGEERAGRLPPGTAERWQSRLGTAIGDPRALDHLIAETRAAGCAACAEAVSRLSLRLYPKPNRP